ncbi:MAG TPA: hypothetical protein VKU85_00900 [bacterium]|nr:hypothetical protein [bacterium]
MNRPALQLPPALDEAGVTLLEPRPDGFVIAALSWDPASAALLGNPEDFAARLSGCGVSAVALDAGGIAVPTGREEEALRRFVGELQLRGLAVVFHGVSAGFVTAATMDGDLARFAREDDLSAAVATLRKCEETRRRCTSSRGRRLNQLRLPAAALSVPALCAFVRDRLEQGGLDGEPLQELLYDACAAMIDAVDRLGGAEGTVSAAATVHDGRATVTLLDDGAPPADPATWPGATGLVDRRHRFRILDRHNAQVLEKDLPAGVANGGSAPVS